MTKQVLFIQGGGGNPRRMGQQARRQLEARTWAGYDVRYPRMPNEADPSYAAWKAALAERSPASHDGAIVVGHSIGGTILVNALAEAPPKRKLGGIFLSQRPLSAPAAGRATASSRAPTSAHGCPQRRLSISTVAARTTPRRLRMSIFMRRQSRRDRASARRPRSPAQQRSQRGSGRYSSADIRSECSA